MSDTQGFRLTPEQKELGSKISLQMTMHLNLGHTHVLQYSGRYEGHRIVRVTKTPKKTGQFQKPTVTWHLDDIKKDFTLPELLDELRRQIDSKNLA